MSEANSETLISYRDRVAEYVEGTAAEVFGASKAWIDSCLQGLSRKARILEVGSAFGRDAAYIQMHGFSVECSDAVQGFVDLLKGRGFMARWLNLLVDDLPANAYDLVLANAVLLHFTPEEFLGLLTKLHGALAPGGRLAFSLKKGVGEHWSDEKIRAPRYFCYWTAETLEPCLRRAGFSKWDLVEATTSRSHPDWLYIIATAV